MDKRLARIADALATLPEVETVAQSGTGFPAAGDGDIDLFVYESAVPTQEARRKALETLRDVAQEIDVEFFHGDLWGVGDRLVVDEVEVFVMQFTTAQARAEAESILKGEPLEKICGVLYPTGRLASILQLTPLFERTDFLAQMKALVAHYPETLAQKHAAHFLNALWDTESFERAVARKDTLFYHQALETALDAYLQALFALNRVYFPSRKRTLQYLAGFERKPVDCANRLLKVVRLGASPDTLAESYAEWSALVNELRELAK